jgi:hypothetical protein
VPIAYLDILETSGLVGRLGNGVLISAAFPGPAFEGRNRGQVEASVELRMKGA